MNRLLIVVAVEPERAAVLAGTGHRGRSIPIGAPSTGPAIDVAVGGVGAAACAASTAMVLSAAEPYDLVLGMGIAGGFAGRAGLGATVVGTASVAADLGAETPDGFLRVTELGFGRDEYPGHLEAVRPPQAWVPGSILTVTTVTGTAARTTDLAGRHPDAVAEAMEGFGVATAADLAGIPFVEIRTISNVIGPRDRDAWRIPQALAALSAAAAHVGTLVA